MIKAQPVKAAELLTRSGAARSAVIALRHDDAVPRMGGGDRGIDGENATWLGAISLTMRTRKSVSSP
jgi:hypothetical protein